MKVHYPKLYNMARLLALNVLLLPKDLTIIFAHIVLQIYEGTAQIQRLIISREWLAKAKQNM